MLTGITSLHNPHFSDQQRETFAAFERVRATVKEGAERVGRQFKGPCQRTPRTRQSIRAGLGAAGRQSREHCNTRHTVCLLERRQKTAPLCLHHSRAGVLRQQSGDPAVRASHEGNCLSRQLRILLIASDRNYSSHLLKLKKGRRRRKR